MLRRRQRIAHPYKPHVVTRRERAKATYAALRPRIRASVYQRDGGLCRCPCRRPLKLETENPFDLAHANEILPRSLGGDPLDPTNICLLAPECHEQFTHGRAGARLEIEATTRLGAHGLLLFRGELASGRRLVEDYPSWPIHRYVLLEADEIG
jgi:5-methylcytosine-specific restriction endonuclease McrA